eukprot:1161218-Pelagomonas_calceolata.AAC.4
MPEYNIANPLNAMCVQAVATAVSQKGADATAVAEALSQSIRSPRGLPATEEPDEAGIRGAVESGAHTPLCMQLGGLEHEEKARIGSSDPPVASHFT